MTADRDEILNDYIKTGKFDVKLILSYVIILYQRNCPSAD